MYMNPIIQNSTLQASPFPDLQPLFGLNLPFFDMKENMKASDDAFTGKFGFISENKNKTHKTMAWFIAGTVIFLILGIITLVIWKIGQKKA